MVILVKNERLEFPVLSLHENSVFKMGQALFLTLNSSISNIAYFFGIVNGPVFAIKFLKKWQNWAQINKIDKSVSYIAVVIQIDREVKKVELVFEILVDRLQQLSFGVLVGNIPDHQSGLFKRMNVLRIYIELQVVFYRMKISSWTLFTQRLHVIRGIFFSLLHNTWGLMLFSWCAEQLTLNLNVFFVFALINLILRIQSRNYLIFLFFLYLIINDFDNIFFVDNLKGFREDLLKVITFEGLLFRYRFFLYFRLESQWAIDSENAG